MICDRCKQKTFVIYIVKPDLEKVCGRECKGKTKIEKEKNNKYPVLSDDFLGSTNLEVKSWNMHRIVFKVPQKFAPGSYDISA